MDEINEYNKKNDKILMILFINIFMKIKYYKNYKIMSLFQ